VAAMDARIKNKITVNAMILLFMIYSLLSRMIKCLCGMCIIYLTILNNFHSFSG
jgi:hypothetical protein